MTLEWILWNLVGLMVLGILLVPAAALVLATTWDYLHH
jgi:hypothetical protein